MEIDESPGVEIVVDCECHCVTHPQDSSEGVSPRTQVRNLAKKFERVALLLKRIGGRIGLSVEFQTACLNLHSLSASLGSDEFAFSGDARSRGDFLEKILVESGDIHDNLDIVDGGTVVKGDEVHILVSSFCPDPALCKHRRARGGLEKVLDLCPHCFFHLYLFIFGATPRIFALRSEFS